MHLTSASEYWSLAAESRFSALEPIVTSISADAYDVLEDELAALHILMQNVRTLRNRLSPITRLPHETLGHIFSFLVADEPRCRSILGSHPESIPWIKVTHVCRHWRQVALDNPRLWTNITLGVGHEWTWRMIARAKQAPLVVYGEREAELLPVLVAFGHLSHTKELNISGGSRYLEAAIESLTIAATPILESLTIISLDGTTRIPGNLFALHAPCLRKANFYQVEIPWSAPVLRNLSALSVTLSFSRVSNWRDPATSLPSQGEFFDALASMPYLEELDIINAMPSSPVGPQRRQSIVIPHLSKLALRGPWSDVIAVLEVIQFPASTALSLVLHSGGDSEHPIDVLLPILQRYSDKLEGTPPGIVSLCDSEPNGLEVFSGPSTGYIPVSEIQPSIFLPHRTTTLHLKLYFDHSPSSGMFAEKILRALCTEELVTLVLKVGLHFTSSWNLATLLEMFGLVPNLKHIYLPPNAPAFFLTVLNSTSVPSRVPLPSLQCMHLDTIDFISSSSDLQSSPITWELLYCTLKNRKRLLAPLQTIDINQCEIRSESVVELRTLVPSVTWDGNESILENLRLQMTQ